MIRLPLWPLLALFTTLLWGCKGGEEPAPPANLSGECLIQSFRLAAAQNGALSGNLTFAIDHNAGTIRATYLKWIDKADPAMLIPEFTTSGIEVTVQGVKQVSRTSAVSFKDEVVYTVKAENGDTKQYRVTLTCPQINGELPVLHIRPAAAITSKEDYVSAKLDIYGTDQITTGLWSQADGDVEIRLRGNSTMGLPKKPYRIKFPSKFSPLGLDHASAKSWVLLANDTDKTLLRNAAAFAMARTLFNTQSWALRDSRAVLFTPATRHVNVYMNGEYIGLYHLSDQIEQDAGRLAIESLKASDGSNPAKITGGYLLEVDIHASHTSEPFYFASYKGIKITPKYPKDDDHDAAQYAYIKAHLETAEKALFNTAGLSTAAWQTAWRTYWDEATAIDFFLVNELTGNPDGFTSINLYKRRDCEKFFFGPVWDFDKAYNNDRRTVNPLTNLMIKVGFFTMESGYPPVNWHGEMWKDATFRAAVKARWNSKKSEMLAAALDVLNMEPQRMKRSIEGNFTVWKITEQALADAMPAPANYAAGVSTLKNYIEARYTYLDGVLNGS